jgi:uncharacterized protein YbjT (DUF2867 family)
MTVLVVGARGAVGRRVVDGLLAVGEKVRASVRDRSGPEVGSLAAAGVEVVEADLTRPDTLAPAFDGVERAFLYAPPDGATAVGWAAAAAGVHDLVLMSSGSVLLPWTGSNAIAVEHRETERAVAAAGVAVTPIRPLVLAGNAANWARSIRENRAVDLVHPESVTAPIHERDIAAVAVAALTRTAHADPSALLTGPEPVSRRRQVELIGQAIQASITVREITEDEARAQFGRAEHAETVEAILAFLRVGLEPGGSPTTTTAREVLGRDPLPFAAWAGEHAGLFR